LRRKYEITTGEALAWADQYPPVKIWLSKIQRKPESAFHLWLFCKNSGKDPNQLLALKDDPKSREVEYLLDNFVADERIDVPDSVKIKVVIAVKSFFKWNYRDLARASGKIEFIKQKPYRRHSKEELLKIYRATQNPRDRALITFTWSTAIARESLQKIQWKHLEPDWEKQELPHIGLPDVLLKGHGRSKYKGVEQHTFLTSEAKRDLLDYKDYLERKGVKITPETNIWLNACEPFDPLGYSTFSKIAVDLTERTGILFSWHDARRYVETALEETKINPNWAKKIRGRKIRGEENPYSRPAIEQLRSAFKEAVPLLQFTTETELDSLKKRQEAIEQIVKGLTPEQKELMATHGIRLTKKAPKPEEILKDCPDGEHCGDGLPSALNVDVKAGQKEVFEQVSETQLLEYLRNGWQIVHKLGSGEIIVKR